MKGWSRAKLCDAANFFMGTMLFFSPWLFDLPAGPPRQTAMIIGLLIAVSSTAALTVFAGWEAWFNLIAGLGLIAASWPLGFEDRDAIKLFTVIGTLVAALAALELWFAVDLRQRGPIANSGHQPNRRSASRTNQLRPRGAGRRSQYL
jgi:hypothetical protein